MNLFTVESQEPTRQFNRLIDAEAIAELTAGMPDNVNSNVLIYHDQELIRVFRLRRMTIAGRKTQQFQRGIVVYNGLPDFPGMNYHTSFVGILKDENAQEVPPYQVIIGLIGRHFETEQEARDFYAEMKKQYA